MDRVASCSTWIAAVMTLARLGQARLVSQYCLTGEGLPPHVNNL